MTNFEKYKKELLDIANDDNIVALVKGKPVGCRGRSCTECDWGNNICSIEFVKWLCSGYEEAQIDWSKVEVDTPILVSLGGENWIKGHFAKFCDGLVYAWVGGCTSWTESRACPWNYAKLQEER